MYLNLLHLDEALKSQTRFLEACRALQARETDVADIAAGVRLWGKNAALERLSARLGKSLYRNGGSGTVVTFMGSGDFHHVSALLIGMLAENADEPFTVIHFDNHPDWVHFSGGMHCGSWVNKALSLPQVARVITLGPCSKDLSFPQFKRANLSALRDGKIVLLPWRTPGHFARASEIESLAEEALFKKLDTLIATRNVYITIDKDVLSHDDAITNWDQGQMPMTRLLGILRHILAHHHAVGIDVTGDYSKPHYDHWLKKIEVLIDQPWSTPANAASINEKSNLALLDCIREAA